MQCPHCEEELLVDLLSQDAPIEPGLSSELAVRLHTEAVEAGRESVAFALTHLFGQLTCPECGNQFDLANQLAGTSHESSAYPSSLAGLPRTAHQAHRVPWS